jgi:hypothetical protein
MMVVGFDLFVNAIADHDYCGGGVNCSIKILLTRRV